MTIFTWHIDFARPLWLATLAALPLWIIFWQRSLVRLSPGAKRLTITLRVLLLAAAAIALVGPTASSPSSEKFVAGASVQHRRPVAPLVGLTAPEHVRAGEPFTLDVLVRSKSSDMANLDVISDSTLIGQEKVTLVAGENHMILPAMVDKPSRVVYSVKLAGAGYPAPGAMAACPIYVDPPPRALLVERQAGLAEHLEKALVAEHVDVVGQAVLPADSQTLDYYHLIVLANMPADALTKSQIDALQHYVRGGGGLIAIGGDHAFTVGGYRNTPLEDLLPVLSVPREKPKPSLAMVLVLDISGSMNDPVSPGAKERNIDLAKEALRRAVGMLGPRDQVGVLVFEDTSRWIWPLSPVTDKQKIIDRIDTIWAEGETNMYPPLEKAYLALRESFADVKHIIVSTDGIGGPGDFEGLARKMAADGITMSTVGVGSEPVRPFLQKLADEAQGRAYFCDNGKAIPQIFQTDTGAAAKVGITEEPFFPQMVHAAPAIGGLDISKAPTLLGYVETQARPEAQVVLATKTGEPILATWRYGRGTTAAFTSDVQSRWAAPWLSWPGFSRFWVQLARETMRREPPQPSRLSADAADGRLNITLDAEDRKGQWINNADVRVTVESSPPLHDPLRGYAGEGGSNSVSPEARQREGRAEGSEKPATLSMTQIAPGRYTASQAAAFGTYWLSAQIRRDGKLLDTVRGAAAITSMPETALKIDGNIEVAERPGMKTVLIWPWLLALAAVVLVLDLAVRRTAR